jgi:hypothetical protein
LQNAPHKIEYNSNIHVPRILALPKSTHSSKQLQNTIQTIKKHNFYKFTTAIFHRQRNALTDIFRTNKFSNKFIRIQRPYFYIYNLDEFIRLI